MQEQNNATQGQKMLKKFFFLWYPLALFFLTDYAFIGSL